MDLLRLRSNMDRANRTRKFELVFNIIILNRTVSKRGVFRSQYMDLIRLRCNVDCAKYRGRRETGFFILYGTVSNASS